jgi:tetratricopeptide (TPR) repeat protein
MTAQSEPPEGGGTRTFHGLTGDAAAEEKDGTGPPPAFERGACLGRYLVLDLLGRGGMGEVYVAYDPELDRKVALKMLYGGWSAGREAQTRLLREAQSAARLTHPNVVRIYDVGSVGDRIFVAMELIDGVDLAAWRRAEPRPWWEVLGIFRQAGRGLAAAHAAGLVHRDFKSGNVLVAGDGRVVVVDFGLALEVGPPDAAPAPGEAAGAVAGETALRLAGTPAYMAPEQLRGGPVDPRADQFGFCAALHEALYGELPFAGTAPAELLQAIDARALREPPPASRVPAWLRRVIVRGLAAEPAERYPSMAALLAALHRDPAARRRRGLAAAVGIAILAAAIVGARELHLRRENVCKGADRKLAGLWDAGRKREVRTALAAAGAAPGDSPWSRVEPLLDRYARDWLAQHTEACEATRRRGEQSESLLDLRMACLEARRQELRAATALLARPDPQVARRALSIARGLSGLGGCADARGLLTVESPPADPAARRRIEQVRAWIAESRVSEVAGRYPEAFALSQRARRAADLTGYRPVQAEALLSFATGSGRMGRSAAMKEALLEALDLAQASRHDEAMARTLTFLILASFVTGEPDEAHLWERLSGAAIERLGGNAEIEAERHYFLGLLAHQEHRPQQAIDHFRRFLALKLDGRTGSQAALHAAYQNLGIAYGELGRFAEARRHFERSLQEGTDFYGPDHPGVAASLQSFGEMYLVTGDAAAAETYFRRSLAVFDRLRLAGPGSAQVLTSLAQALLSQGRAAEAVPLLERAARLHADQPQDPLFLAQSRFHLARALWMRGHGGDRTRARHLARDAAESFSRLGDRARRDRQEAEAWIAAHGGGR